ncbi:MAG: large conductance mechanosensitive channel protein MscL [Candidatus Dormibacteria bacterium]
MTGFKAFILRGNLVQMATAFVMGITFAAVIGALVGDLLTPLIAAIVGKPNFGTLSVTLNHSHFLYGAFIDSLITFILVAAALYFFVVMPFQKLSERMAKKEDPTTKNCTECLSEIPLAARRCSFCTEPQPAAA